MTKGSAIKQISDDNNGVLRTAEVVKAGISRTYFLDYIRKNGYKKLARGIYLSPDAWEDSMFIMQSRFSKAIFSYETALYLLGLSQREPAAYEVTVSRGYNASPLRNCGVKVYTVNQDVYGLGIVNLKTPMNNFVKSYDAERTLCDIFKPACNIEIQDKQFAIREYLRQKGRNIPKLMDYAEQLKVKKHLRQYLEVLL